jgi:orotate phosphoribosyltransferase
MTVEIVQDHLRDAQLKVEHAMVDIQRAWKAADKLNDRGVMETRIVKLHDVLEVLDIAIGKILYE